MIMSLPIVGGGEFSDAAIRPSTGLSIPFGAIYSVGDNVNKA